MLLGEGQDARGVLDAIALEQALADRPALGDQERVGHAAADDERVDAVRRCSRTLSLSETLAPPMTAANGSRRCLEQGRERLDLPLHEQAGVGRQELGDADGRGMRPVRRPEGVVDVDVGVGRERLREGGVVGLLLGVEAEVLEQEPARA